MANTTASLKNVNLLNKSQFDVIPSPATDELWAVDVESDSEFKSTIVGWGMPDYSSGISVPATQGGTYTAHSDGLFIIGGDVANTFQYYIISILDAEDVEVVSKFGNMVRYQSQYGSVASVMCPLPKGYKVKFNEIMQPTLCAFYPMKGV